MNIARAEALAARDHLAITGWIPRRSEAFRHLPPPGLEVWLGKALAGDEPAAAAALAASAPLPSTPLATTGWTLHPLGGAVHEGRVDARWLDASEPGQRAELFAGLTLPADNDAGRFGWAHRATCRAGLRLRIGGAPGLPNAPAETVYLMLRHQPQGEVEAPLLVIDVQAGVRCVLLEMHEERAANAAAGVVQNLDVRVTLASRATLQHVRVVTPGADDRVAHLVQARLGTEAHYDQALIASGSAYHLQRTEIELHAAQASTRMAGALFAASSSLEQQVHVSHAGAATVSEVEALALASGNARAVVNAYTRIAPGSDGADVRQRLSAIPTGGSAGGQPKLVLRPHLEIHHDQVQAVHGATWGALPEDALFYARQRGLDERSARTLIVAGMLTALLERCIADPEVMQALEMKTLLDGAVHQHLRASTETSHA
ncbi:MAG: SufD family Fe-S cluster assembly protein [Burkholderiaceae bacterium]